ncbi:MAG: 2-amino-4-hydroxy-6-hydroxymethyldihydropteridine diphosphokinase [Bacteroidetes bacterium]|nr:2-amino-4-hydroxy-6-hydroxymethyldihydropteridine diphosphokinase [Bacteroidota bacterium]
MNGKNTVFLGLGSNKGERISYIENVISKLENHNSIKVLRKSGVYETEPWGISDQPDYLNSVLEIETTLGPMELLVELKSLEKKTGRSESKKWSEREIDIDILFYGDLVIKNENINIPHSFIEERKFVLVPLAELDPEFIHPVLKRSVKELLETTKDKLKVVSYGKLKSEA